MGRRKQFAAEKVAPVIMGRMDQILAVNTLILFQDCNGNSRYDNRKQCSYDRGVGRHSGTHDQFQTNDRTKHTHYNIQDQNMGSICFRMF